ncbi:MAG TPA: MBL fold metallo-hydrolase [Chloroflexota bacterium]|jgi:glyoxylase-like metal-dependent hydrolase (beta-lactamase superfamily II)
MADNEHYVESRRFGEATVTLINDGSGQSTIVKQLTVPEAEWRRFVPEASARGEIVVNYHAAHVAIAGASILIDLGFDDPSEQSQWKEPRHHRSPGVQAGLASIGVQPEEVTHVLITHAHGDHFAGGAVDGRPRFPKARVLLGRADWEGNPHRSGGEANLLGRHLGAIERAGLLQLVDGEHEVVPGVTMIHAPGESPGHSIVRVESGRQRFYFLGDLFHHPCEVANLDWVSGGRDAAVMRASRERLLAEAVPSGATLVYTHSLFPGWGKIVREGERYRWVAG